MTKEGGANITEVTRWHADDDILFSKGFQSCHCIEVVECLWQEAGYVDAVG